MGFDKIKVKQVRNIILLIAFLVLVIMHSEWVFKQMSTFFGLLSPFIIGGVIAFVLNLPMRNIENRILKKWKGKRADKFKRPVSIILSILFILALVNIVLWTVIPQIGKTIVDIGKTIPPFFEETVEKLESVSSKYPEIQEYVEKLENIKINWNSIVEKSVDFMKSGVTDVLSSTVSVASGIVSGFVKVLIGFIFALYVLSQKEILQAQFKKIMRAYLPEKSYLRSLKVFELLHVTFSNFVTGQCLDAAILGLMFVVGMTICRLPYAVVIGILIALTALIPIVGAFIGFFVGTFLIIVVSPIKALIFVILFFVLQQIEENLIYPKIVGNKVGLPAIWVLAAVTLGGSLFGVAGMIFFIPLVSTAYILLRDSTNERLKQKDSENTN